MNVALIIGRMDTNTTYNDIALLEVVDTGRRRRFSIEAKRRIVEESYRSGDSVSTVARRHGIFPSQLFSWRSAAREGAYGTWNGDGAETGFVSLRLEETASRPVSDNVAPHSSVPGRFEVICANGRRVIVDADVSVDALLRIVRGLEAL